MNYRKHGFTQRKPTVPGVYFISTDGIVTMYGPRREAEKWDVAEIIYYAGSYTNVHENREDRSFWQIKTLSGTSFAWRRGMWIKGPIAPYE